MNKPAQDFAALLGMRDLRMKLQSIESTRFVADRCQRCIDRAGNHLEPRWRALDTVTVTHPDVQHTRPAFLAPVLQAVEQTRFPLNLHPCMTVFASRRGIDGTAQLCRQRLHAIANTQHRNS